ncbi:HAD-IA family hydrolase [bacterium]|nr:HAD-IA family hydrolase [bacterium]
MQNKEVKAIIFDLGGVYFEDGIASFKELSKKEGFETNRFLEVIKKKYFKKIETGKMSEKDFWHKFKHDVGFKMPIAEAKSYFLSHHQPMSGMKELVKALRKKYKVGLLTNNTEVWYEFADKHYKISKDFDAVVVSAKEKVRKPDKKIYKIMAQKLGVTPEECIFFDDFLENVTGAQKVGMKSFQFTCLADTKQCLADLNLQKTTKKTKKSTISRESIKEVYMPTVVSFKVNNKKYFCLPGTTILKALGENNIYVHTLCYSPIFPPKANCRLCLVEVKGQKKLVTACSTEVKEGMDILVDSSAVVKSRKTNLKLLYQDHIGKCPTCIRLKNCELLKLVGKYQAGTADFKGKQRVFKKDTSGVVVFDFEKCIKCRRCIEACKKYGSDVLEIKDEGFNSIVGTKNGKLLKSSGCISCKQCAQVCPVGAIYEK